MSVESLDELDRYLCDCGHGFVLLTVGELSEPESASVVALPQARPARTRRAA